nr:zinc finger, CCHC-type [Tanacetum cinerariifolium]
CSPVSTPMDPVEKLKPYTGKPVDQLEYSRAIGYLMYAMTSTRPDIAYVIGRLSRFTSNPSRQHWKSITRVFKYLRGTKYYGLSYVGYPSMLEGYSDASWINHVEDSSSTSGWVFLLRGDAISWASKKQTCITGSTMKSEFVALTAADRGGEYYDPVFFQSVGFIQETTASYTPQQNGMAERKNKALKEMVNSMLSYLGLSEGIWGEAMLTACYLLNKGCGAVVRLPDPKRKTLSEKGIDCIFVGYAEYSKAYRWIFKKKMKVDGTIDKFEARLVIQGFRQKKGIDYFDTYAPVSRITTIRLLLALVAIQNLVIHQMDVKTAFLNGDLDEEVYMKQPEGFVMPGNEHKVCKLVKSLYGLKQAPKQWHQKFIEVVLSSGFHLNQSDKCVYRKVNDSDKGVIICLYVDDMLIFGTDQNQVDKTKKFLSSRFSMKDMGEADVILGIKIKHENKGIVITQSHYIKKILKKFNHEIVLRFTSNPSRQHWKAITRINHVEESSSMSGWVFLLGKGAISWASKKQTCINGSTMKYEFVALAAAGKEAEWLKT